MAAKGSFANTIKFLIRRFEPVFRPVPGHNSAALRVSSIKETLTGDKEKLTQNDGVEKAGKGLISKAGRRETEISLHIAIPVQIKLQQFVSHLNYKYYSNYLFHYCNLQHQQAMSKNRKDVFKIQ